MPKRSNALAQVIFWVGSLRRGRNVVRDDIPAALFLRHAVWSRHYSWWRGHPPTFLETFKKWLAQGSWDLVSK